MTEQQKKQIIGMRQKGHSHAAIADALGLSRNTVKSFCLRNIRVELHEETVNPISKGVCDQCGKGFTQCLGHRQRRFCSEHCRMVWWNAHRDLLNSNAKVENICACCGKRFMVYARQQRKYCTHNCYIAYRYKKEA